MSGAIVATRKPGTLLNPQWRIVFKSRGAEERLRMRVRNFARERELSFDSAVKHLIERGLGQT